MKTKISFFLLFGWAIVSTGTVWADSSIQWMCRGSLREDGRIDRFVLGNKPSSAQEGLWVRLEHTQLIENTDTVIPVSDSLLPVKHLSKAGERFFMEALVEAPEKNGQRVIYQVRLWAKESTQIALDRPVTLEFGERTTWVLSNDEPFMTERRMQMRCLFTRNS